MAFSGVELELWQTHPALQKGHSAFANKPDAEEEVFTILDLYARVYEEHTVASELFQHATGRI